MAPTPSSATSALPTIGADAGTPGLSTKGSGSTPVATTDKPLPPHLSPASRSKPSTPPPLSASSGRDTPKDGKLNGGPPSAEKAEKDRAKRERKKERKQQEKAEKEATKESPGSPSGKVTPALGERPEVDIGSPPPSAGPRSGKATPDVPGSASLEAREDGVLSPTTESGGARTPTGRRGQRNPWTIFMRMSVSADEQEIRDFFADAKGGITKINYPSNFAGKSQKMAYIEFGDEQTMNAGLEKHLEKLKDTVPEVKQATDKESRNAESMRGGFTGRGGRGRGFAARGFAAAGLTRPPRPHGDEGGKPSEGS